MMSQKTHNLEQMGNFKYRNITSHREHIYTQLQRSVYQAIELEELQAVRKQVTGVLKIKVTINYHNVYVRDTSRC
ncbi:putative ferric reductase transmembrane component [Porites harrisoni]